MIGLQKALQVISANKSADEKIFGAAETDDLFIFTVEKEENLSVPNMSEYVKTVDKATGSIGSLSFEEYCAEVDANRIRHLQLNNESGAS